MVGRKIASYALARLIGEGRTGSVFEAVQEPSGRRVAIRILRADYADQPKLVKRFFNETADLDHLRELKLERGMEWEICSIHI